MSATAADIETGITAIIAELLGLSPAAIARDADLAEQLGMKALDRAELALEIEADFGIVVFTKPFSELRTVGDVIEHVAKALRDPLARREEAA